NHIPVPGTSYRSTGKIFQGVPRDFSRGLSRDFVRDSGLSRGPVINVKSRSGTNPSRANSYIPFPKPRRSVNPVPAHIQESRSRTNTSRTIQDISRISLTQKLEISHISDQNG
ncbi:unnamed protein product, partial [Laminaria digitata]